MSATNRGAKRRARDCYFTPAYCTRLLVENVELPGGFWLEPTAGEGAIITEVNRLRANVCWSACEIRPRCAPALQRAVGDGPVVIADFLKTTVGTFGRELFAPHDVAVSNPPYYLAQEVLEHSLELARTVVLLLRLNYLESEKRANFLRAHPPDVYVLPSRPSFCANRQGKRGTDATAYAWMVWPRARRRRGSIRVLPSLPREERI